MNTTVIFKFILVALCFSGAFASCPTIFSKDRWGGRSAKHIDYIVRPVKYVIIHHTVSQSCSDENACCEQLTNIQSYHMDELSFNDIGYNFMIGGDGNIYEGVGWHKEGAHTYGYNKKSIGIAFIGDFRRVAPNQKQLKAAQKLIQCGEELGELDRRYRLLGARSVSATESPGLALFRELTSWKGFTRNP
ncbi:PGRPS1 [Trypoxylus dichotomus]